MKGNCEIQVCLATLLEMAQEYFDKRALGGIAEFEVKNAQLNSHNAFATFKVSAREGEKPK